MHAAPITLVQDAWMQKGSRQMALYPAFVTLEPVTLQ